MGGETGPTEDGASRRTSFVKLMQSCSKPLVSKISNPAISSTPINVFFPAGFASVPSPRLRLIRSTSWPKFFSYSVLLNAASSSTTCSRERACVTHSRPALTFGRSNAFWSESGVTPRRNAAFSSAACEVRWAEEDDEEPATAVETWPRCRIAAMTRNRANCSMSSKPTVSSARCIARPFVSELVFCVERIYGESAHGQGLPLLPIVHAIHIEPRMRKVFKRFDPSLHIVRQQQSVCVRSFASASSLYRLRSPLLHQPTHSPSKSGSAPRSSWKKTWKLRSSTDRLVTRDFSSRYQSMLAPAIAPAPLKKMRTNLPCFVGGVCQSQDRETTE